MGKQSRRESRRNRKHWGDTCSVCAGSGTRERTVVRDVTVFPPVVDRIPVPCWRCGGSGKITFAKATSKGDIQQRRDYLGLDKLTQQERYVLRAIKAAPTREAGDELFNLNATAASEKARIQWLKALEPLPSAFASLGPAKLGS